MEEEEEAETADFEDATLRHRQFLFLVVEPRPFESSPIVQALDRDLRDFGRSLRRDGAVIRVSPEDADAQLARIAALDWPESLGERIARTVDPVLLVLDRSFEGFSPGVDRWALIWLAEHEEIGLHRLFTRLAQLVRDPAVDLLDELHREQRETSVAAAAHGAFDAIEVKPSVFGISVDLRALVRALLG